MVLALVPLQVLDISANLAEQLPGCVLQLTGLKELHAGELSCAVDCCHDRPRQQQRHGHRIGQHMKWLHMQSLVHMQ